MTLPRDWVTSLQASCTALERAATAEAMTRSVPWCPGMDVGQVLAHLGVIHRLVRRWVTEGHRPPQPETMPLGSDPRQWFAAGWPALCQTLAAMDPAAEASTWCSYDTTVAFWWRRMAHEAAIHAADVQDATAADWSVGDEIALDGIDEALRLWLGTQLGAAVGGTGNIVRLVAGERFWTVVLNDHTVEVTHLDVPPVATVHGAPETLYRWVWGRARDEAVAIDGRRQAIADLRSALGRSMQ